ncbi:MAG: hypothetical protein QME28_09590 [Candidatus Saccharicenans sp.]|nr:hypothetical protein [Candidatus Saccharicenans sp.]
MKKADFLLKTKKGKHAPGNIISNRPRAIKPASILSVFFIFIFLSVASTISAPNRWLHAEQAQPRYYNLDREITVEGQVEDLRFENRYEGKGAFLVLFVRDKNSQELLEVETAPAWFFRTDIHKGEKIRLTGSLSEDQKDGRRVVVAREIRINSQTITLRDRRGFPAWSRAKGKKRVPV